MLFKKKKNQYWKIWKFYSSPIAKDAKNQKWMPNVWQGKKLSI